MARNRILYPVLVALVWATAQVGTATAAATEPEPLEAPGGFVLQGSHGYLISVFAYSEGPVGPGKIEVTARRGEEAVSYLARAKVTPDRIRANLGRIGRVDLVLHLSGSEKTIHPPCFGRSETYEAGTYEGIFELNGEGGFTRARATRLNGLPSLGLLASHFCRQRGAGESRGGNEPGARLAGISYAGGRTLTFQINKNQRAGRTIFKAAVHERRGGIKIYRELSGVAPASAFRYAKNLRTATLAPPAPFTGSASLRRRPNAVSPIFTGDLSVDFPGRSVKLAGPAVHVGLVHARLEKSNSPNKGTITVGLPGRR
jgi:hypothetical protein